MVVVPAVTAAILGGITIDRDASDWFATGRVRLVPWALAGSAVGYLVETTPYHAYESLYSDALGLAILATVANSRTQSLFHSGVHSTSVALTKGFDRAFLVGAGFAIAGAILTAILKK